MNTHELGPSAVIARTLLLWSCAIAQLGCAGDASNTRNGHRDAGIDAPDDADPPDARDECPSSCAAAMVVQSNGQVPWECEAESLCDDVEFEAPPGFSITTVDAVTTVESAHCALRALRDGQVGFVSFSAYARSSPGVSLSTKLFIRPERVALSVKYHAADLVSDTVYGYAVLQPSPYFESCGQESDPAALFDCLQGADATPCSFP